MPDEFFFRNTGLSIFIYGEESGVWQMEKEWL
jgi:hypothetical protein